jgi:hypothetical protein
MQDTLPFVILWLCRVRRAVRVSRLKREWI